MKPERMASPNRTAWEAIADAARYGDGFPTSGDATAVANHCRDKRQAIAMGGPIHGRLVTVDPRQLWHIVTVPLAVPKDWTEAPPLEVSSEAKTTTYDLAFLQDGRPVMVWEHLAGQPDARTTEGETP